MAQARRAYGGHSLYGEHEKGPRTEVRGPFVTKRGARQGKAKSGLHFLSQHGEIAVVPGRAIRPLHFALVKIRAARIHTARFVCCV